MGNFISKNSVIILLLIFLAAAFYLYKKAEKVTVVAESTIQRLTMQKKLYEDSLKVLTTENLKLEQNILEYKDSLNQLAKYKSKVIIKYRDQKTFVDTVSSLSQLDSIIRTNTGLRR